MPYIKQEDRERLAKNNDPKNEGELNYLLTVIYNKIIEEKGVSYSNYGSLRTEIQILTQFYTNQLLNQICEYDFQNNYRNDNYRNHNNCDVIHTSFKNFVFRQRFKDNVFNFIDKRINNIIYNYLVNCNGDLKIVIGALINSSEELYRVKIAPYEDKKMLENGPV